MAFKLVSAKLTGSPGRSGWAQVHDFKPENEGKVKSRGHLFAVISTSKQEEGVDSVVSGREILSRLHEEYFGKTETPPLKAIKLAVKKVIEEFSGGEWGEVEVAAASLVGEVVYCAAAGGAKVLLVRETSLAEIITGKGDGAISASGRPKPEDVLVLATSDFFSTFSRGVIKGALSGKDPSLAVESLAPAAHSSQETGSLGGVFVKFEELLAEKEVEKVATKKEAKTKTATKSFSKAGRALVGSILEKLNKIFPKQRVYVESVGTDASKKRKVPASVGIILVILLLVSIGFGIKRKKDVELRQNYETELEEAEHNLEEALSLYSLNPERSRELFSQSKTKIEELLQEDIKDKKLEELKIIIEENEGRVLGEFTQGTELFVNLSLLSEGFDGDRMAADTTHIVVLDKGGRKIVETDAATKRSGVVAGPDQINKVQDIALYSESVYIINDGGVYLVGEEKDIVIDRQWQGSVLSYAYAGNFYVLEKEESVVWRHPGIEGGFASGQNWFAPGVTANLSGVIDWAIDGSIWMLNEQGDILKFSLGNPERFFLTGLPDNFSFTAIYTNEEMEDLYLLDKSAGRLIVVNKEDGSYEAQYMSESLNQAKDFVVSQSEKKIMILTGEKLVVFELLHLKDE